jgi:hypothetical protein
VISPHILVLSAIFGVIWGWHVVDELNDWRDLRRSPDKTKMEVGHTFRALICAVCLESICLAYVFRTTCIMIGLGENIAAQVAFFTILGVNLPGGIFTVVSRRLD